MKKKLEATNKLLIILMLLIIANSLAAQYSGGTGTEDNPYQIADLDNLQTLSLTASHWSKHFILTANIDATDTENWNDGKGFSPIGAYGDAFSGSFDGRGHTISDLFIYRNNTVNIGFFGYITGASIKNTNLNNLNVTGAIVIGGLVGRIASTGSAITEISNIQISNCTINGGSYVGGLAGEIVATHINNCSLNGTIYGGISIIGGLVGLAHSGNGTEINNCILAIEISGPAFVGGLISINQASVTNCRVLLSAENTNSGNSYFGGLISTNIGSINSCNVSGEIVIEGNGSYIGGVVAQNSGTIINCYTSVVVISENSYYVGGLAGENEDIVKNCYSSGDVSGKNSVGGLAGINTDGSQTTNCYATGMVYGEDKTGGFVGENSYFATLTNCYSSGMVACEAWFSGGLIGLNRSTAITINSFFDIETSGKTTGTGMDHNGQNQQPVPLTTYEFNNQSIFTEAGWQFGDNQEAPWQICMAPDGEMRPVLFFNSYTIVFETTQGGVIKPDSLQIQTVNCSGNSATIQAIADENYYFAEWQNLAGDSITNINPLVVENVISDSTLVAIFYLENGIEENMTKQLKVYPNPAKSVLNIDIPKDFRTENTTIEFFAINGNAVLKLKPVSFPIQLDIRTFKPGLYIVKIQNVHPDGYTGYITKRVVVQ